MYDICFSLNDVMKKIFIGLFIVPIFSLSQNSLDNKSDKLKGTYYKLLLGKWRSVDDKNWTIQFTQNQVINIYKNDTGSSLIFQYKISPTCELKDTSRNIDSNGDTYLLFFKEKAVVPFLCHHIEGLNKKSLSYMNYNSGT